MVKEDGSKLACIFPGQGAQYVGMGQDIYNEFKSAKEIFDKADQILQYNISKICFEGPLERLFDTKICQPAIFTTSIAFLNVLREAGMASTFCYLAGLSLGEYSALVAAESINFEEALRLVDKRAKYMHDASLENHGKMASILGLSLEEVKDIIKSLDVEIANINCPQQVVVSAKEENINKVKDLAEKRGAKKVIILNVSGPFHSSLMTPASLKLKEELKKIDFKRPKAKVIFNVSAEPEDNIERIKENLAYQVNHTTYWQKSIEYISNKGIECFLEIGPGTVLRGLLKRINRELKVYNLGNLHDLDKIKKEL